MLKRRMLPLLAAVALLVALSSAALASDPTPAEREQRMAYIRWRNTGLQTTDFNFDPAAVLTRGMAAEVFARLLGLRERAALDGYADVGMDTPHAGALAKCVAAGIIGGTGGGNLAPEAEASRDMLTLMLTRALDVDETEVRWEGGALLSTVTGYELLTVMDRMISAYCGEEDGVLGGTGEGLALVAAPGVTVGGRMDKLVITPGAGESTILLENATVNDNVMVHAPATVFLKGNTTVENVTLSAGGERARVAGDGFAVLGSVTSNVELPKEEDAAAAADTAPEPEPEPTPAPTPVPEPEPEPEPVASEDAADTADAPEEPYPDAEPYTGQVPEAEETYAETEQETYSEMPPMETGAEEWAQWGEGDGVPYTAARIGTAALLDQDNPDTPPYGLYAVSAWEGGLEDNYQAVIRVTMRALRPYRTGAGAGYWTGFRIEAPEGATGYKVAYSPEGDVFSTPESFDLNNGGFSRYFDAARWSEYYVLLQWTGPEGRSEAEPTLYKVDMSDVELDTSVLTTADSPLGKISAAALAPDTGGVAPYTSYGATVENVKDANGSYLEITVHADGLKKHRSIAGAGFWAGFAITEPRGAGSVRYSVYLSLDAAKKNFAGKTPVSWEDFSPDVDGFGAYGIRQLSDASQLGQRDYWAVVQWYEDAAAQTPMTAANVYHIVLDVHLLENTRNGD